jgi:hypothetical protein
MRHLAALVVVAAGCNVEVGAGKLDPVAINAPIDTSELSPPFSLDTELVFLTADQSAAIADQFEGKLGAVDHVDVEVEELSLGTNGTDVAGGTVVVGFEGISVDHVGQRQRLPDATKDKMIDAVKRRAALALPIHVGAGWPMPPVHPSLMAHAVLQPIVTVNGLETL